MVHRCTDDEQNRGEDGLLGVCGEEAWEEIIDMSALGEAFGRLAVFSAKTKPMFSNVIHEELALYVRFTFNLLLYLCDFSPPPVQCMHSQANRLQ
jgi:hypothetical protein